ncbi:hypothetical protein CI610_01519 [invertebrate metagenome]|uniref:Uncharacterized protein n=1 Tax=invertebrate metagenome TaxID=1711999 RepID=A0A2H9T8H2_9ZZZZ
MTHLKGILLLLCILYFSSCVATEWQQEIDPKEIYFTHSRIMKYFSCGRSVDHTIRQLLSGSLLVSEIPKITVRFDGIYYYSENNRRLFVFKSLREKGVLNSIVVRIKDIPDTRRKKNKYSPEKYSLHARYK